MMPHCKEVKSLSSRFQNKAEKQYEAACSKFTDNLRNALSLYLNGHKDKEHFILSFLSLTLKNTNLEKRAGKLRNDESYSQSLFIEKLKNSLPKNACYLCQEMFRILLEDIHSDLILKVENEVFLVHKHVLCARSSYFAAMLGIETRWSETNNHSIVLGGITAEAFAVYLCYLYGAFVDPPDMDLMKLHDLVITADMFGSEDFKTAMEFFLQRDACHFFHKPCSECIENIPEAMRISSHFHMSKLYDKCLKWNVKHFNRLWQTKSFCAVQHHIHNECYTSITNSLNVENVIKVTLETDGLIGHLTHVKWAMPAIEMANRLLSVCLEFIADHLNQLIMTSSFLTLFQGIGCRRNIVEEIFQKVHTSLSIENCCLQYNAIKYLLDMANSEQWSSSVTEQLKSADEHVSAYVTNNYFAIIHCKHWNILSIECKNRLQTASFCQGDPLRKPTRKPVLSSSIRRDPSAKKVTLTPRRKTKQTSTIKQKVAHEDLDCVTSNHEVALGNGPNRSEDKPHLNDFVVVDESCCEIEKKVQNFREDLFEDFKPIITSQEFVYGLMFETAPTIFLPYDNSIS